MATNLIFIDSCIEDYQTLAANLDADTEWFLLNAEEDGVVQMAAILSGYTGLASIQIVSHGASGQINLGTTQLTQNIIAQYQTQLAVIGNALSDTGDLLLYGCNVAQGDAGQAFISALANATEADVAASTDLTGNNLLGGNWMLEAEIGVIEASALNAAMAGVLIDTTPPTVIDAGFDIGGAEAAFFTSFSESVMAGGVGGLTVSRNGTTALTITGAAPGTVINPNDSFTFSFTGATLAASDYVVLNYNAGGGGSVTDLAGNPLPNGTIAFGSQGTLGLAGTTIDLASNPLSDTFYNPVYIVTHKGNDTVAGTSSQDYISTGRGSDTIDGSWSADIINLSEGDAYSDTVILQEGRSGYSDINNMNYIDVIYGFDVSGLQTNGLNTGTRTATVNTAINDTLNLPSNTIAANVTNAADHGAINFGALMNHSITSGMLTFHDANTLGNAVIINAGNLGNAMAYLKVNLIGAGQTVAFAYDSDSNGSNDSTIMFQQEMWDNVVILSGITGVTLGTAAGQNVVQLIDNTAPEIYGVSFSSGANASIAMTYSENVHFVAGTPGTMQLNGAGGNIATGGAVLNNALTITTATTLAQTDWILGTIGSDIADAGGNATTAGMVGAFGGSGDSIMDLTGVAVQYISGGAGNDTITGGSSGGDIEGAAGADTMSSGLGGDNFRFQQGDSTAVTFSDVAAGGGVNNTDTFTFAGGMFDRINNFGTGDYIQIDNALDNGSSNQNIVTPSNGLATNGGYFVVQGGVTGGIFTVNSAGTDTLVVYDGDPTNAVLQTAFVISNVTSAQLIYSNNYISYTSAPVVPGNYTYSALLDGAAIAFNPVTDTLNIDGYGPQDFDISEIESGDNIGCGLMLREQDPVTHNTVKTVSMLFTAYPDPSNMFKISSDHIVFSGGKLMIGDNDATTVNDDDTTVTLNGGADNDVLVTAGGSQVLNGGDGNDYLVTIERQSSPGSSGTDVFNGGNGIDTLGLDASLSDNTPITQYTVNLAAGTGSIASDAGNSSFTVSGIENVDGSDVNDLITGDALTNNLYGWWGNDTLNGGGGNDTVSGGDGDDTLNGGGIPAGNDFLDGGAGADTADFTGYASAVWVKLGYNDLEAWTRGTTSLTTGTWRTIADLAGIENVTGSQHADQLFGDAGSNALNGGGGNDTLTGGDGNDILNGGGISAGNDILDGGLGTDIADFTSYTSAVWVSLGYNGLEAWTRGATHLASGTWRTIADLAGIENVFGSGHADQLIGDAGNNLLVGGNGNDSLTGGAGQDIFRFDALANAVTNLDTITDFSVADDTIQLENAAFTSLAPGALAAGMFISGAGLTAAADANDYLVYNSTSGALYYDADGNGAEAAVQLATLVGAPVLTAGDFAVV